MKKSMKFLIVIIVVLILLFIGIFAWYTSKQIRLPRNSAGCPSAYGCTNCIDNVCDCKYIDGYGNEESIQCTYN